MKPAVRPVLPPPFPAVALQLMRELQADVGAADVAHLIERDPTLTVSLLRLANSPFFGLRRQVSGVGDAVMVLGMSAVRRLVMSLGVAAPIARGGAADPAFARAQWQRLVSCAAIARRLVGDSAQAELAFVAGLLHDIGAVQLLQQHGAAYVALHAQAHGADDLRTHEAERFGMPHDRLGAELLEAWGLPQPIADAARRHHENDDAGDSEVARAVRAAHRLADAPDAAALAAVLAELTAAGLPAQAALDAARIEIEALSGLLNP